MLAVPLRETARRRLGPVVAPLYAVPGRALLVLDAAQHRRPAVLAGVREPRTSHDPTQLLITVAHWRASSEAVGPLDRTRLSAGSERLHHLLECVRSILEFEVARTVVAITTNEPRAVAEDLDANVDQLPSGTVVRAYPASDKLLDWPGEPRGVLVIGWAPSGLAHRHPYYLTWAHKHLICSALQDPGFSHFLYLEDDLKFTKESLCYWCEYREPLASYGLLPGFVRVEALNGSMYVVDQSERTSTRQLPQVSLLGHDQPDGSSLRFVNLPSAYQGMYVLDRQLAVEHCRRSAARDPWRSRALVNWGIRERAAVGPILDDVPAGFHSRNVVPVRLRPDGSCELDRRCTLEHLPGNYTRGGHPDFGIIRVSDMFASATTHA